MGQRPLKETFCPLQFALGLSDKALMQVGPAHHPRPLELLGEGHGLVEQLLSPVRRLKERQAWKHGSFHVLIARVAAQCQAFQKELARSRILPLGLSDQPQKMQSITDLLIVRRLAE